ncbi:hypothetical protein D6D21_06829 [Aureobasidium pullulans]|uniref:Zn(2)-C6 fungal-type domain-containing protein n=1 Tax=Aureobasidium pullulans TaxID=5580 RepID=A0AB74IT10_AURPU|nr:hypothetical protein D6D21_06829 [Aureobasidium pullulans]
MNQANQDPRQSTPLPTRVSKACDRCKRNKSRCDSYRPCSLCLRANAECTSTSTKTGLSRQDSTNTEASVSRPTAVKRRRNNDSQSGDERRFRSTSRLHSFEDISDRPNPENFDNHRGDTRNDAGDDGEAESTMSMARKIYSLDQQHLDEFAVNAIPGAEIGNPTPAAPSPAVEKYSTNAYLTHPFPPSDVVIELLDEYFASVHWFSLVIYEPKFREMFTSIQDGLAEPSQKSFLILLSTMLGMASWYRSQRPESETGRPSRQWKKLSSDLFKNADNDLINIMDQNSISAIQTLILLGSFYCYHGRPNLSFSMLGASLRTAQALGLHREPSRISFHDCEERKRVWWTIYTWDMFAAVTYGRPLGIHNEDCTVTMPSDFSENIQYRNLARPQDRHLILYSRYQTELNKLYMIASPVIKKVYGTRLRRGGSHADNAPYLQLVKDVTTRLWGWRSALPQHLLIDLDNDCPAEMSATAKAHCLQALALQLTFDNLLIILHRPFLAWHIDSLTVRRGSDISPHEFTHNAQTSSPQEWWDAALRTSRITELPQLAQIATDSHLVAFLAINLFNSAIAMVVMALSDPLSDKAQEVKRITTRIFRLQDLFGRRSKLSMQSSTILKNVVQLLLRRENEAIFAPVPASKRTEEVTETTPSSTTGLLSVRETLNLPLGLPQDFDFPQLENNVSNILTEPSFNQSLASVQKVFSSSSSGTPAVSHGTQQLIDYPMPTQGSDHNSAEYWSTVSTTQNLSDPLDTLSGPSTLADSNGVYWFWDTMWDGGALE